MKGESSKCKPKSLKFLTLQWRGCQQQTLCESWNFILDSSVDSFTTEKKKKRKENHAPLWIAKWTHNSCICFISLLTFPFSDEVSFSY